MTRNWVIAVDVLCVSDPSSSSLTNSRGLTGPQELRRSLPIASLTRPGLERRREGGSSGLFIPSPQISSTGQTAAAVAREEQRQVALCLFLFPVEEQIKQRPDANWL